MARTEMAGVVVNNNNLNSNNNVNSNAQVQQQQQQQQGGAPVAATPPAPSPPPANGSHSNSSNNNQTPPGYNNNAPHGGSSHSTTTSINNSSSNSISRPNGGPAVPAAATNGGETPPVVQLQLLHDPGITAEWSAEEQAVLDEGLDKFAAEPTNLSKYIKVANLLPEKTVRDVAMRCRWMTKKEIGKRRKPEDQNANKKNKEKKDKSDSMSNKSSQNHSRTGVVPTYIPPPPPVDNDDGISNDAIGGPTGKLLEENSHIIGRIRANLAACKLPENTDHLVRFRDNIFAILNGMTNMPGIMSQMPPLPVKLNTELADTILPKPVQAAPPSQS